MRLSQCIIDFFLHEWYSPRIDKKFAEVQYYAYKTNGSYTMMLNFEKKTLENIHLSLLIFLFSWLHVKKCIHGCLLKTTFTMSVIIFNIWEELVILLTSLISWITKFAQSYTILHIYIYIILIFLIIWD